MSVEESERAPSRWGSWLLRLRPALPLLAVTVAFFVFRLPVFLNAGYVNSDGAATALQASRMMDGVWELFHWKRYYLTSLDSAVLVPFFFVFGKTALVATVVTALGQLASVLLAFAILKKRVGANAAALCVLPLAFATMAFNIYLYFYIRQWCLAAALGAFWLLDGAVQSRWWHLRLAGGLALGFAAVFIDVFAIQFVGPLLVFAVLCALDERKGWRPALLRVGLVLGSAALSAVALRWAQQAAGVVTARAEELSLGRIPGNFDLLWKQALPWLLGTKLFELDSRSPHPVLVEGPWALTALQWAGGLVFALAALSAAVLFFVRRVPWEVRRLGALGLAQAGASVAGFLLTETVVDIWAARMLAPVLVTIPFLLAPAAHVLRGWRFPAALSPYLAMAMVAAWLGYGEFVRGVVPVRTPRGAAREERNVGTVLREKGVHYAGAHYWLAYRLMLLFGEDPVVVPLEGEQRYEPFRTGFDQARKVAYLFHPWQPWNSPATYEAQLRASGTPYEKLKMYDFTILIADRQR